MPRKATVTMADVARKAGVSVASVSNYLNDRPYMSESMRARIAGAIESLGYQINLSARNLRSGQTHLLKFVIPDLRQIYFAELAEDVLAAAHQRGYGVIVESTSNSRERELEAVRSMGQRAVDGLILSPLMMQPADAALLRGDYPLVVLGERLFDVPAPHVMIANRSGVREATEHLLRAGCRHIAVVGAAAPDNTEPSSRTIRTQGYRDALREAGVDFDPALMIVTEGWGSLDGLTAARRMIDDGLQFDAVLALNDLMAWGVMRGLRDNGVRVPEDVRVVGFDDLDESAYMSPSLSAVNPNRPEIARLAVESVVQQIEHGGRMPAQTVEAPARLVCRESSPAVE